MNDTEILEVTRELGGATVSGDWVMRFGRAIAERATPVAVQEERDAWQPIEIPPTNGALKLFCDMKAEALRDTFFVDWMVNGKFCMDRQRKATHWMDLPDYPDAAMKGDQP